MGSQKGVQPTRCVPSHCRTLHKELLPIRHELKEMA
jgi:hypothetical protein